MYKWLILLILLVTFGCAPKPIDPIEFPKAQFERTESYVLKGDLPEKPEKPELIPLDGNFRLSDLDEAEYFAISTDEFNKILQVLQGFNTQKEIIEEQVVLVNLHISTINQLKELIHIQEVTMDHLARLYANEQYLRQVQLHEARWNDITQKAMLVVQAGLIIGLVLF